MLSQLKFVKQQHTEISTVNIQDIQISYKTYKKAKERNIIFNINAIKGLQNNQKSNLKLIWFIVDEEYKNKLKIH